MSKNESQAVLDFVLAFIAVALLLLGIVRIWIWFDANYARRQYAYQQSRLAAGTPANEEPHKPIDINATESCPTCGNYKPLDLTEEWVFKGTRSGTVSGVSGAVGSYTPVDPEIKCKKDAFDNDPGACKTPAGELDPNCAYYVKCLCNLHIQQVVVKNNEQISRIGGQQGSLADSAAKMRKQASKCDDPWETCWWVSGLGRTADELRGGANELDRANDKLSLTKLKIEDENNNMQNCCGYETKAQQDTCFTNFSNRLTCEACRDPDNRNPPSSEICLNACRGISFNCSANAESVVGYMQNILDNNEIGLRFKLTEIDDIVKQIDNTLTLYWKSDYYIQEECDKSCVSVAGVDPWCVSDCVWQAKYNRDKNCREKCCGNKGGWGRNCKPPSYDPERCEEDCSSGYAGCVNDCNATYPEGSDDCLSSCWAVYCPFSGKCSLATYETNILKDKVTLEGYIAIIEGYIKNLPSCCDKPTEAEQVNCIIENSNLDFMNKK